jgi:choline-sulfatase
MGSPASPRRVRRLAAAALLAVLTACGRGEPPACAVLVTLDTTRADVLSCYGGPAGLTPHLDSLAAEGLRFTRAYTVAPMTLPAHASMLTGLFPPRHTVRDNGHRALPAAAVTVAEQAAEAGLQTAAFVSASVLHEGFGLAQGFERYDAPAETDVARGTQYRSRRAHEVVADARAWLDARDRDRGYLLWVHLWDPHAPYQPPAAFRRDNPYHGEVASADDAVGQLLGALRADPAWERTTVVVVADHGEAFGEHGEWTHGPFAYEPTMRVPLIVRAPGAAPAVVDTVASVADVAPTLARALELPALPDPDGRELLGLAGAPAGGVWLESLEGHYAYGWAPLWGWVDGGGKYLDGGRARLFEPVTDPGEQRDLAAARAAELERFRAAIREAAARPALTRAAEDAVGDELLQAVQELGYAAVGEDEDAVGDDPRPLAATGQPDPLDRAEELRDINRAGNLANQGRHAEAEALYARITAGNPGNLWAQEMLGALRLMQGRPAEGIAPLLAVVRAGRGTATTFGNLAGCYRALGQDEKALPWLERALERNPEQQNVRRHLAEVLEALGRREDAARVRAGG